MWLPSPIYERVPQFWFLLGLLFLAAGLLLGFEFALAFWYIAIGLVCCATGAGIYGMRRANRPALQGIQQAASPQESAQAETVAQEPVHAGPAHTE